MTASLTSGSAVQQAKHQLRKQISTRLKQIPPDQLALQCKRVKESIHPRGCECADERKALPAARRVIDRLVSSASYRSAASISCYLSLPHSEVQTDSLIHDALAKGKRVYVPYCPVEDKTTMRMVRLRDSSHFDGLRPNRWGIREVDPKEVSPSLVFQRGPPFTNSLPTALQVESLQDGEFSLPLSSSRARLLFELTLTKFRLGIARPPLLLVLATSTQSTNPQQMTEPPPREVSTC